MLDAGINKHLAEVKASCHSHDVSLRDAHRIKLKFSAYSLKPEDLEEEDEQDHLIIDANEFDRLKIGAEPNRKRLMSDFVSTKTRYYVASRCMLEKRRGLPSQTPQPP